MSLIICDISISADGFAAGPEQSMENPLGIGGEGLHEWLIRTDAFKEQHGGEGGEPSADSELVRRRVENVGAQVMGRNMFGPPSGGEWDPDWTGWWGDDPPFHVPVYVVTHHPREPLEMEGGTTFHFVTDGVESALSQAQEAAGDRDVLVAGGANLVQQCLRGGHLDELYVHVSPVLLGAGERLFEDVGAPQLEIAEATSSKLATHIRYLVS